MNYPNIQNHLITCPGNAVPEVFTAADGACYTSESGRTYINCSDISCVLGYRHPAFTQAVANAALTRSLGHFGTFSPEKETLIRNFMEVTHGDFDKISFTASGGEVVDWSIKAARRHTGRDGIIGFQNALHGRSFAGAYISGTPARKAGFGTGLQNVFFWPYPEDGRPCEPTAEDYSDIAAVIIEPYQALGGMVSPTKEYWHWLREFTRERGIVLILDEIQTGFGKTGPFFAYEESGIVPDILLVGKGMSNGFGMGAMLMSKEVASSIRYYEMAGGSADNAFLCSVVNAVFEIYREENILGHVRRMGAILRRELAPLGILRGQGLFMSLEVPNAAAIVSAAAEQGITLGRSGNRILLRPPLVITEDQVRQVCRVLQETIQSASEQR